MRIGSFLPRTGIWASKLEDLASRQPGHDFILDPESVKRELPSLDAIIANRIPDEIYHNAESLSAVFVPFAGVNHLPAALLLSRGVHIYNSHGNAAQVAERALALTLAFYGRVIEYHEDLRRGIWHGFWVGHGAEDQWPSLYGRKAAIFGAGAIGSEIARLLKAFDCEVIGYRRRTEALLPPNFDRLEPDFDRALAEAELLFLALPLTASTRGLFSKEVLMRAKGKFLVNMGRGELVDEEGLYLALKDEVLFGAAIDTWYLYPRPVPIGESLRASPSIFSPTSSSRPMWPARLGSPPRPM